MTETDPYDLKRFVAAQEPVFASALAELRAGRKQTHWMWFVFPHCAGSAVRRQQPITASLRSTKRAPISRIRCWDRGSNLHQRGLRDRGADAARDFRLARRHEVPFLDDAVRSGCRRDGELVPQGSRSLVTGRADTATLRLLGRREV